MKFNVHNLLYAYFVCNTIILSMLNILSKVWGLFSVYTAVDCLPLLNSLCLNMYIHWDQVQ